MTRTIFGCLAIAYLLTNVLAASPPKTTKHKFSKHLVPKKDLVERNPSFRAVYKRQTNTINADITNFETLYMINVTIGTPGQEIGLQLDTGSSDLWVPAQNSTICSPDYYDSCYYGSYNLSNSSTYKDVPEFGPFFIAYVDGTEIDGTFFNDTINIDGASIIGATMAIAEDDTRGLGLMGVSFTDSEYSNLPGREEAGLGPAFTYPSVLDNMLAQGHIASRSYALWLDDLNDASSTGTILFGGVDTEKYLGSLIALPIQPDSQTGTRSTFTVAMTGLQISTGSGSPNIDFSPTTPQPVILDSGTTLTYLPDDTVEAIFKGFGVLTDPDAGNIVPCTLIANNYTFIYSFGGQGGPSISVPLSEILLPLYDPYTGEQISDPSVFSGAPICQFGIDKAGGNPLLLGDTFLRSAYVVYDLDNFEIALAQTNFQASANDNGKVNVISASAGIPDVSVTASAATVQQTFTGVPGPDDVSGTATGTANTEFGDYGSTTVTRSATFEISATGTVPVTATGVASSGSSRVSGGRTSAIPTGGSATGSSASASASATNDGGHVQSQVMTIFGLLTGLLAFW